MRGECERWEERKYGTVKKAKSHEKAMVDYQIVYGAKERTWRDFIVAPERKPKLAQKLEAGSRADYPWYRSSGRDSDDEYESDAWSEPDEEERTSAAERTQQDLGNAENTIRRIRSEARSAIREYGHAMDACVKDIKVYLAQT